MVTVDALQITAQVGVAALRRGEIATARQAFEAVVEAGRATPQLWLLLAQACEKMADVAAADRALDQILATDNRNLFALTMKGDLLAASGDDRAATSFYQLALANAPPLSEQAPDLRTRLMRAEAATQAAGKRFVDHLESRLAGAGIIQGEPTQRFVEALEILHGVKAIYHQQPTSFYYPRLPLVEFYDVANSDTGDGSKFSWVRVLVAALPSMQAELAEVLSDGVGLQPYVATTPGRPNRGHALLDDPQWSAYHLWKDGVPTDDARRRCPVTLAALEAAPLPRIAGRSPMALFSVLRPHTHIPPHNGMLNTRLICHIPLIVPSGCRLRVGNTTRDVAVGKVIIFDDSVEHEAWNDSDQTRVVLLFEIWRPELDAGERFALTKLFEAINSY